MLYRYDVREAADGSAVILQWAHDKFSARLLQEIGDGRLRELDLIYRGRRHGKPCWFSYKQADAVYPNADAAIQAVLQSVSKA